METSINNKCKAFTSLEQSKKLAKILPLESSDGYWDFQIDGYKLIADELGYYKNDSEIPCWSLAALLAVLPNGIVINKDSQNGRYHFSSTHAGTYVTADNPIDACYEVIIKLYELKML